MVKSFVLIETVTGTSPKVVGLLRALQEVQSADRVTGPYDVVAILEAVDLPALVAVLEDQVRSLPDVRRTITCVVAS